MSRRRASGEPVVQHGRECALGGEVPAVALALPNGCMLSRRQWNIRGMWFMRERVRQWPLHWVFAYYAIGFGVFSFVADSLFGGASSSPGWALAAGVLFAALMTPITWWRRKQGDE